MSVSSATALSNAASQRLAAEPSVSPRYGLGIALRKPYQMPSRINHMVQAKRGPLNGLEKLPELLHPLLVQRIQNDSLVAAHLLSISPVQTVHLEGAQRFVLPPDAAKSPTVVISIASGAKVEIVESAVQANSSSAELKSRLVLVIADAGADIRWQVQSVRARGPLSVERLFCLGRNAQLTLAEALVASDAVRSYSSVLLKEPGAAVVTHTLFAGVEDHQFDVYIQVIHEAPRTSSNVRARGVLSDTAQAIVRGLVRVAPNARGADGYQRFDTLLLSSRAEVDPVPMLEIENNDARCTHSVATGHLDPDRVFYLQSRGCSADTAQRLLVDGFLKEALAAWSGKDQEQIQSEVATTLNYASPS